MAKKEILDKLSIYIPQKKMEERPVERLIKLSEKRDRSINYLVVDAILVQVLRDGLTQPLTAGLQVEAAGFAACKETVDYDIGMKNFIQNGPRVPAAFMHE